MHSFEVIRYKPLRKNAPVLTVKMGIKLGGNNVYVRCRLHREEEHVCNEKQAAKPGYVNYAACIRVSDPNNAPEGLQVITIPAGDYAEFVHEGAVSDLFETCDYIYRSWFPSSGLLMGEGPMVEVYPENFTADQQNPGIRLLVSVKGKP